MSVEVAYTQYGMGELSFVAFKYLLETGAAWKDTIGSADLVVRLPYEANEQNVIFTEPTGWSQTTPNAVIAGRELRWHFADLEPAWENNLEVSLIIPEVWRRALTERENTRKNPKDGEAWGRLGKVCKEMIFLRKGVRADPGGEQLYKESLAAYEQAVALKPKDALWHYGFADLLWGHYYWNVYMPANFARYQGTPADMGMPELLRAANELKASLDLSPGNPRALELLDQMSYSIDGVAENASGHAGFPRPDRYARLPDRRPTGGATDGDACAAAARDRGPGANPGARCDRDPPAGLGQALERAVPSPGCRRRPPRRRRLPRRRV